ncbi:retrovirus-related pol polyprotein from transposon TNT 1-94 [Tanacetum coccineum]
MTGNKDLFTSYTAINGGNVLFGGNTKSKIIGKGMITHNSLSISNVSHVENLSFNLLSVGQICDKKCKVLFSDTGSEIIKNGITIGKGTRKNGLYVLKIGNSPKDSLCLTSIDDTSTLWHRRLGHANMRLIQSLSSKELVRNLPKLKYENLFCDACNIGKQVHESHKAKNMISTSKCLELLHMDLFGPSAVQSYGGNFYTLVIVDDYSRYTWIRFLKHKNEAFDHFEILSKKIQKQKGSPIISIRLDHGREFDNEVQFGAFCDANGITHNFSAPRTPQSNGVVERKNRTLQEMSRTLLNEQSIPQKFWCNAVDTSTYILNRILIRPFLGKTPYELFKGKKPNLEYFKVFGSKCFILNTKDYLTKFDPKSTEGIFLGYSPNSKAYVVLNKETMKVKESLNVKFDETPPSNSSPLVDDDSLEVDIIENKLKDLEVKENEPLNKDVSNIKESKDKLDENGVVSRKQKQDMCYKDYNQQFGAFCDANGITHNFSAPRTPQSNEVVELDTSTYILNRILIRPFLGKTPYELFKGKKPNLEYFKVFGSKCFILNTKDYLTKFDPKSIEGIFLGYSPNSKAYVILNKETMKVEESLNIKFDETPPSISSLVDDDLLEVDVIENKLKDLEVKENEPLNKDVVNIKESRDHLVESIIGNLNQRTLRS